MAPIVVSQISTIDGSSAWIVGVSVLGIATVVSSLTLSAIVCACGKKKEEEVPPTDDQPKMSEPAPAPEPMPEEAPAPSPEEPVEKSAKTAIEAKSVSKTQTSILEPKGQSLVLMSKRGSAGTDLPSIAPAAKAVGKAPPPGVQPSLKLMEKSAVQAGKPISIKATETKSMTGGAAAKSVRGGKSVSVNPSTAMPAGSVSVNPATANMSVRSGKSVSVAQGSMLIKSMGSVSVNPTKSMVSTKS